MALCWRSKLAFVLPRVRLLLKVRPLLLRCWMSRFCPCLVESKGFDLCLVEGKLRFCPCAFLRPGVYIMKTALFWLSFKVLPGPLSYWESRFCFAVEGQKFVLLRTLKVWALFLFKVKDIIVCGEWPRSRSSCSGPRLILPTFFEGS